MRTADTQVSYENFVSYFLYTCEETMAAFSGEREWKASCDYDLKAHLPFLCEKNAAEPDYLVTYAADTRRWVLSSMQQRREPPDCKLRRAEHDPKSVKRCRKDC